MNIDRTFIDSLSGIKDEEKSALLAIYDGALKKDEEISALRSKQPTDSQCVVDKLDYGKLQNALKERELLVDELRKKMEQFSGQSVIDPLSAFAPIVGLFSGE